jgi:hypothetical protein
MMDQFIIHEHTYISGPNNRPDYKDGKYLGQKRIRHSHPGGEIPHTHEHTGPSHFGHRQRKYSKRPIGEQLAPIPRTEEENTFELVIMDSALVSTPDGLKPIGDTPIEALGFPAASRMMDSFGMQCIVRDERKKVRSA